MKKKTMEIIKVNDVWKSCDFSITATAAVHSGEKKSMWRQQQTTTTTITTTRVVFGLTD